MIFNELLQFAIPCWLINMSLNLIYVAKLYSPSLVKLDKPLDGNRRAWDNRRILGNSTTVVGIAVALLAGIIIQMTINSDLYLGLVLGLVYGVAVYFGHAASSFIKRRCGYMDGQFMPLVDHGNYIVVTGLILGLVGYFSWKAIILAIILTYIVHPIVTYLSYLIKWHKHPL